MAVVSVRLNKDEEKILNFLTEYFHEEKSTLFKKAMHELYEDIQDIRFVEEHITKKKDPKFISGDSLFS